MKKHEAICKGPVYTHLHLQAICLGRGVCTVLSYNPESHDAFHCQVCRRASRSPRLSWSAFPGPSESCIDAELRDRGWRCTRVRMGAGPRHWPAAAFRIWPFLLPSGMCLWPRTQRHPAGVQCAACIREGRPTGLNAGPAGREPCRGLLLT